MTASASGNLVIGQSGGPTPVINASLAGILQKATKHTSFLNIFGLVHGIEGALKEDMIDLRQEPSQTIDLLATTPSSILGSCRHKLSEEDYERILKVFIAHEVQYFIYIGGNDSMDTCHQISELASANGYELYVAGVPKTIDNDLTHTDHSPGYGSAAKFVATSTRDAGLDLEAMGTFDDVTILETMGRNSGWLAASSVLAKECEDDAPHLVYVPEVSFDEDRFLSDVSEVHGKLGRVFVVVCEGIRDDTGRFIGEHVVTPTDKDQFGHTLVALTAGVASYLSNLVRERTGLQSRFLRPGLIGRDFSASVSEIDRQEALMVGRKAVDYLVEGDTAFMVTLNRQSNNPYSSDTDKVPLVDVANKEKTLPGEYINKTTNMITQSFIEYALPLIDGPLPPTARLKGVRVPKFLNLFKI
ncbi:MAG: diphosphate--fructose-6-phosphate 1-phosphotransferase [Anaerolineales bacterium]|nr:diphosphate--fructose-6-phosphate 1-phosphotransferase [Anaerolineales bacterium]